MDRTVPAHSSLTRRTAPRALALLAGAIVLAACSASKQNTADLFIDDRPPGVMYNEGLAYLNEGKLKDAAEAFGEVDRIHPYSEWARKALIMSAFANYRRGRFDDTVSSSKRYLSLYPGSNDSAYAHYLIGSSYFKQIPDVTRDQQATRDAITALNEIIQQFPDSEYAADAQKKIIVARDQMAGKQMQVGRYYLERREYTAAINRFQGVVLDYQNTRHVEEALERLTEANLALGLVAEAQNAAAILGHNFPNSSWYKDAYALLQSGGLEPRENRGSALWRVFGSPKSG
ncbi:MAG: outer membrane protein assembly factor BamD [Alphaproteobacteria bacterium]